MTTLATDPFTGTNGAGLGANWTAIAIDATTITIQGNQASGNNSGSVGSASSYYSAVSFPNDQWAQATIGATVVATTDLGAGPVVRAGTGLDMILLQGNTVETRVYKHVSGAYTQLGSDGPAITTGDILYLEVQGSTVISKKNGTSICGSPISGGTLPASGKAAIWLTCSATIDARLDDFSAGDFLSGGVALEESEYYPTEPQTNPTIVTI